MRRFLLASFLLALLGSTLAAEVGGAQQVPPGQRPAPGQRPGAQPQAQETTLVFDREVFTYPWTSRRDPFLPLLAQDESGPRFEEIKLVGVVFSPNPDLSVAVFGPRGGGTGEGQSGGPSYRARRGDRLGNIRILEIQLTRVVVAVDEFGETQQHVMELQRPGQGGL